jgi:hypothetical protein
VKTTHSNDGDESPEGVLDSASLNPAHDEDFEQQEVASKKTRKRRQRRRKHKNKNKDADADPDLDAEAEAVAE